MSDGAPGPDGLMLFDGVCRFCSTSVRLALRLDRRGELRFTPLQSPFSRQLARAHGLDPANPDSFVFFDRGVARLRSDGALALAARLPAPWRWARVLRWLPRSWRDGAYNLLAANCYRLFGRRQSCMIPTAEQAPRFVTEAA